MVPLNVGEKEVKNSKAPLHSRIGILGPTLTSNDDYICDGRGALTDRDNISVLVVRIPC